MDNKYVVFSRRDWEAFRRAPSLVPEMIEDAVVIRTQDIFAAPALYAYANCISTCREILNQVHEELSGPSVAPPEYLRRLREIEEYFMDRGDEADNYSRKKVPD